MNIAFWNVQNLFEPNPVRGPATAAELAAKIETLAEVLNALFAGEGPDVLGLAEVHTESVFHELVDQLDDDYLRIWEPAAMANQTGLGAIAKRTAVDDFTLLEAFRPTVGARPRVLVTACRATGSNARFLFVVNHWKSRLPPVRQSSEDREETAAWLGQFLQATPVECAVIVGDFNAEPYEEPFRGMLRGRRTFRGAFSPGASAHVYNTAWRFMGEREYWAVASQPGYREQTPTSSHGESGDSLFDQLLVTKRALKDGPLELQEDTVQFICEAATARHNRYGVVRPRSWEYNGGTPAGSSDHFPLVASFKSI
jgi:endonuclease/exonuclease/phosphatase family metal-dependent hydrolase